MYGDFVKELVSRGMARLAPCTDLGGGSATAGLVFVRKKADRQRIIFDTRLANCDFAAPPSTHLPSAAAFARMETMECDVVWCSAGDIQNAFYAIEVPEELGSCFRLPSVRGGAAGLRGQASAVMHTLVLTVLPMGWSWALRLCQLVTEEGLARGGLKAGALVKDREVAAPLGPSRPLAAAGYVGNFMVMGGRESESRLADEPWPPRWRRRGRHPRGD